MIRRVESAPCLGWLVPPATLATTWSASPLTSFLASSCFLMFAQAVFNDNHRCRELGVFAAKSFLSARFVQITLIGDGLTWRVDDLALIPLVTKHDLSPSITFVHFHETFIDIHWMSSHAIIPFLILTTFFCRKLVLVNNSWRQPQLLRLPRNYDSIFQVRVLTLFCNHRMSSTDLLWLLVCIYSYIQHP